MTLCDWHKDVLQYTDSCPNEAILAVKVGSSVGRYCGEHLKGISERMGSAFTVFPVDWSDDKVLETSWQDNLPGVE